MKPSEPQSTKTSADDGKVVSAQSGQGIRKATVRLTDAGEGTEEYETTTDAAGVFRIEGVPSGEYAVTVTRAGYFAASKQASAMQVTVESGAEVAGLVVEQAVSHQPSAKSVPLTAMVAERTR